MLRLTPLGLLYYGIYINRDRQQNVSVSQEFTSVPSCNLNKNETNSKLLAIFAAMDLLIANFNEF
jgi:hypothetical protein